MTDYSEDDYQCDHLNIEDEVCMDCGMEIEDNIIEYETRTPADDVWMQSKIPKKEVFSYYERLSLLDLEPIIASNVCRQISKMRERSHVRVPKRIKNLFVMIYIAYTSEGREFNPSEIGKKLEMTPKSIREAVKMASVGIDDDGEKNPVCVISPFNFIKEISELFSDIHQIPEDNLKNIEEFIDFIMDHNQMLGNENPKGMAIAILKMYYDHNRINIPDFLAKTKKTVGYIKIRENMIIKTLNSISC